MFLALRHVSRRLRRAVGPWFSGGHPGLQFLQDAELVLVGASLLLHGFEGRIDEGCQVREVLFAVRCQCGEHVLVLVGGAEVAVEVGELLCRTG